MITAKGSLLQLNSELHWTVTEVDWTSGNFIKFQSRKKAVRDLKSVMLVRLKFSKLHWSSIIKVYFTSLNFYVVNKTITSFFSDQTIFEESSLQFDHELDEWSNTNETLQISFDHAKIMWLVLLLFHFGKLNPTK